MDQNKETESDACQDFASLQVDYIDSLGDGIIITDRSGLIVRVNTEAAAILALPLKEIPGHDVNRILTLVNSETGENVSESLLERVLAEEKVNLLSSTLLRIDGEHRSISGLATPFRDKNCEIWGMIISFRDSSDLVLSRRNMTKSREILEKKIDERTRELSDVESKLESEIKEKEEADKALQASTERYRNIFYNAPVGIYRTTPGGDILLANPYLVNLLGFSTFEELAEHNLERDDEFSQYSRQSFLDIMEQEGEINGLESEWFRKDGHKICIRENSRVVKDEAGNIVFFEGIIEDISVQKKLEQDLRTSEAYSQSLFESAPDPIIVTDGDGSTSLVNSQALKSFGYSRDEMLNLNINCLLSTTKFALHGLAKTTQALDQDSTPIHIFSNVRAKRITGKTFPVFVKMGQIAAQGETKFIFIFRDISDQKKAELKLRKLADELENKVADRTRKLDEALRNEKELHQLKSRFLSIISHEFRTPLASINSSVDLLRLYTESLTEEKKMKHLQRIKSNIRSMIDMFDDVLFLNKSELGKVDLKPTACDLEAFLREFFEEITATTECSCPLDLITDDSMPPCAVDTTLLRHIFTNLMTNACKFSRWKKPITVEIHYDQDQLSVFVRDQGIGIPEPDMKYLFEPFHRGDNVEGIRGSGLGLTIVKRCVDLYGGTISVNSEIDVGTEVAITLPILDI